MREKLLKNKYNLRVKRKRRVRAKVFGTAEMPRISVFRSNRYFYAQAIDDTKGTTLTVVDGRKLSLKSNKADAIELGKIFAENLKSKNIQKVAFDRNGYLYHGVVASFVQSLRDSGIDL